MVQYAINVKRQYSALINIILVLYTVGSKMSETTSHDISIFAFDSNVILIFS
uniref:Uncharacterized protein n=1 Tax=Anguilla anguilla TaxID=7936 RepID=A0A0E9SA73_ANGAN